jgi:hypothetical protein
VPGKVIFIMLALMRTASFFLRIAGDTFNFGLRMWLFKKKQQGYFFADFIDFSLDKSN